MTASPKKSGLLICICAVCITLISGTLIGCSDKPKEPENNTDPENTTVIQTDTQKDSNTDIQNETEPEENTMQDFELTEEGKAFLEKMCRQLPDFSIEADMNDEFWKSFIFSGYTSSAGETVTVYREDMGFEETQRKVSLEEVSQYTELTLGKELPDIKPALSDMTDLQTALYYDEGYYYIGASDFGALQYVYESCDVHEDYGNPYALVTYNVYLRGTESVGTVTMRLNPADNENNFVITSKVTDLVM